MAVISNGKKKPLLFVHLSFNFLLNWEQIGGYAESTREKGTEFSLTGLRVAQHRALAW